MMSPSIRDKRYFQKMKGLIIKFLPHQRLYFFSTFCLCQMNLDNNPKLIWERERRRPICHVCIDSMTLRSKLCVEIFLLSINRSGDVNLAERIFSVVKNKKYRFNQINFTWGYYLSYFTILKRIRKIGQTKMFPLSWFRMTCTSEFLSIASSTYRLWSSHWLLQWSLEYIFPEHFNRDQYDHSLTICEYERNQFLITVVHHR